jgi:hypothetical protein
MTSKHYGESRSSDGLNRGDERDESMKYETATPELGPFQDIWDAWEEAREELLRKPLQHFREATGIQFDELAGHLEKDDREAASREAIDLISVALNVLRWLGFTPAEIEKTARSRARERMKGQALQILEKYEQLYHI